MVDQSAESPFRDLDILGQWLSGGLILFGLAIPCVAGYSLLLAEQLVASTEGLHFLAMYCSQAVAIIALGTGYCEHKAGRVLGALVGAFSLQAWALAGTSCCGGAFVRWLNGATSEIGWLDFCSFAAPLLANTLLLWAYGYDGQLRARVLRKSPRRKRSAR